MGLGVYVRSPPSQPAEPVPWRWCGQRPPRDGTGLNAWGHQKRFWKVYSLPRELRPSSLSFPRPYRTACWVRGPRCNAIEFVSQGGRDGPTKYPLPARRSRLRTEGGRGILCTSSRGTRFCATRASARWKNRGEEFQTRLRASGEGKHA